MGGIKHGTTLVLKDALPKQILDGGWGFRIEDCRKVEVSSVRSTTKERRKKREERESRRRDETRLTRVFSFGLGR